MKTTTCTCIIVLWLPALLLADARADFAAAKVYYQQAAAMALKPIREKYLAELKKMKDGALLGKDLALATELDKEIKLIESTAPAAGKAVQSVSAVRLGSLQALLPGTSWKAKGNVTQWRGVIFKTASTLVLLKDGQPPSNELPFHVRPDEQTIEFKFSSGKDGVMEVSRDRADIKFAGDKFEPATD